MLDKLPEPIRIKAVSGALDLAFRWIEGKIGSVDFSKAPSHQAPDKPCTTCLIHQHVVLARGYIEGLRSRLNSDGSVPAGLGGTIPQAQDHLKEAMMEIPTVVGAHPAIDAACKKLSELLPDIMARLEYVNGVDEWDIVLEKLKLAEDVAYTIPETMYRREPVHQETTKDTIVVLKPEQKELLDLVSSIHNGELTDEEATTKLAAFLTPGE